MKLGIISLGGRSSKLIARACKKYFDSVDMLDIRNFEVHLTSKGINVTYEKKNLEKYDCIYLRGSFRYSLLQRSIARALSDEVYIPISAEAYTIGHDKFLTLLELQRNNIPIPKTHYAATASLARKILEKEVRYPVIIKVPRGTHGKGVMIADSLKSARTILDMLEVMKEPFIMQEFVKTKKTSDIRAVVVGDRVIAAYKRKAAKGDIRSNIHSGGTRDTHKLTTAQKEIAIRSAKAIKAEICGVDILNSRKPSVIEINLSPGISAVKEVTGVNAQKEIAKYLYKKTKEFKKTKSVPSPFEPLRKFLTKFGIDDLGKIIRK